MRARRSADHGAERSRITHSGRQEVKKGARGRGGWKIEQERSTAWRSASACRDAYDSTLIGRMGNAGIAHRSPPGGGTEGIGEKGGAGFPEHNAPEQGAGRSRGVSSWGVGSAPARLSSSRWAQSLVDWDR
jgi:hypothetical protein